MAIQSHTFRQVFPLLLLLHVCSTLPGYQLADGAPPAPRSSDKYIFYWGSLQADLTRENNYRTTVKLTVHAFRQMLLRPPSLWNGKALAQQLSFRLDGHPITATRGEQDYVSRLGWLDETFSQKAGGGQALFLTDLYLDGQVAGNIEILLEEPERQDQNEVVRWQSNTVSMLNTRLLEQATWGREDIHDVSNRDFFTADEFWQTIRQAPFVVWNPEVTPTEIRASIQISSRTLNTQGFAFVLDPNTYQNMLVEVFNYKHLVRPGSVVTLALQTDQYERLFEKALNIVADDDPRLALRRNRDTYTVKIKWGNVLEQTIKNLYLLDDLRDAAGNYIAVDAPTDMRFAIQHGEVTPLLDLRVEVWIDGMPVPDLAYSLSVSDRTVRVLPGEALPDSLTVNLPDTATLRLHSLQAVGYDLSSLAFSLNLIAPRDPLLWRNSFAALMIAPGSARIALHPPVAKAAGFDVEFELKEPAAINLSIFEPDGWQTYNLAEKYPAGLHRVGIPRGVFRNTGKHYLFLNTPFGVAKQEFEVR